MIGKLIKRIFGSNPRIDSSKSDGSKEIANEEKGKSDFDEFVLKIFVHLESLYRNQPIVMRRSTDDNRITLSEVLDFLFEKMPTPITTLAVMHRTAPIDSEVEETIITDAERINNFDLFSCVLKHKNDDGHYTQGMSHEVTLIASSETRNYILTLMSLGGNDAYKYMRVTLMSPDSSSDDDCRILKTNNKPITISFVLSNCEEQSDSLLQVYESIEASYRSKEERGVGINDLEREYVHGKFGFQGGYYIGYGDWLFEQNRYYDAYSTFERAFNFLLPNIDDASDDVKEAFLNVCNKLGTCASKLGREEEAAYFFKQGTAGVELTKANQLALSHARLGNPIAVKEMNDWLLSVAKKYGEHDNWSEEVVQFSIDVPIELNRYRTDFNKVKEQAPGYNDDISLEYAINLFFAVSRKNLAPCIFVYDNSKHEFLQRIKDVDKVADILLNREDAKDKTFVMSCSYAHYLVDKEGDDQSILATNAILVLSTHTIKSAEHGQRLRFDAFRCNFPDDDDKRELVKYDIPVHCTFTLSTSHDNEAFSMKDEDFKSPLRRANSLVHSCLFVEAYKLSLWVYENVLDKLKDKTGLCFDSEDGTLWNIFFESAFEVGFCLMEMGKMREALYYLEVAAHSNQNEHVQEYINCLSNTKDPLALEIIDDIIARTPKPDEEDAMEEWNFHMSFLNRRKVYVLIEKKRYDEARKLLMEMLDNPLSKEFAQGELAYIDSLQM